MPSSPWPYWWDGIDATKKKNKYLPECFSPNENVIVWLTEFPLMLAISFNFLNTPPAVRLAGWNIIRWLLRELSATSPKSPFSCASALTLSNCRPGNEKADRKWWRLAAFADEEPRWGGFSLRMHELNVWVRWNNCALVSVHQRSFTSCLSNGLHQHRLADAQLHPEVGRTQLVQAQVDAAQQVV